MSVNSSRRSNNNKKESIYREIGSGRFIGIRTIDELEDIIDTSEAYMTDPTVIFNSDNTKVLFYYNTKDPNEIEEMETLFKRTVKKGSILTLSDAFYLDESSGDDTTYDLSGTYKFEKYDINTKTIIAVPISINKQSDTYIRYDSRYWLGSLLWTTEDEIVTTETSHEIINFLGNESEHSFFSIFGKIKENDKIDVNGVGIFTVKEYKVDSDESWERIVVKEQIPEKDLLGELTHIRLLRSDRNQPKKPMKVIIHQERSSDLREKPDWLWEWWPWLPDLVPTWNPLSPGWTPSDIIPDKPDWWPNRLPWMPDFIPAPGDIIPDWNLPDKPDWWPDWPIWPWPDWASWMPDFIPAPGDIIPDRPSWWPDFVPWNPFNIKVIENDRILTRPIVGDKVNSRIYMQALSVQRALYSYHKITTPSRSSTPVVRPTIKKISSPRQSGGGMGGSGY